MKRREFVLKTSLAGMLLALEPWTAFANSGIKHISLKPSDEHVRHSGFNSDALEGAFVPLGNLLVKRDRFYANGSTQGENDLFSWHIKASRNELFIQSNADQFQMQLGNKDISFELGECMKDIEMLSAGLRCRVFTSLNNKELQLSLRNDDQVMVLKGSARIAGHLVSDERALTVRSSGDFKIRLRKRTAILVVSSYPK